MVPKLGIIKRPALVILRIITSILLVTCQLQNSVSSSTFAVEVDALLEFKGNYISMASRHLLQSWTVNTSTAASVCESWVGVACIHSNSTGQYHIQALSLPGLGLQGSLAPHLGNLSFLATLDLSTNSLTGSIPTQLMGCTSLQVLDLNNNSLSGPVPSSLAALPSLMGLGLCNNSLTGPIPSAFFTNLSASFLALSLCMNRLTGCLPPDPCLHLPNLEHLLLWRNNLTGAIPLRVANCTKLAYLELFSNHLTGPVPAELGLLPNLEFLRLDQNGLTGAIPPSLGNCTHLTQLNLEFNQLTGRIPSQLGLLREATLLAMSSNRLTGGIPPSLSNCTSLIYLQIGMNQHLSGVIPMELGLLGRNLRNLILPSSNLSGVIPSSLANCTNLAYIYLGDNQLRGIIPTEFKVLDQVGDLQLHQNHLSGLVQRFDFSNFTSLTRLWLSSNELSGSLSTIDFSKLLNLQDLNLSSNYQITGEIPWDSFTNSTARLFSLDLSNNQLTGTGFPSILARLQELKFLYLQGNLLQGGIPEFADLHNLSLLDLDLSVNHLNGSLPSSLAPALITLAGRLDLSHNDFSGSLPPWLGQLVMVTTINLSNNKFTGNIPESLGDCAGLTALYLSQNQLSGNLPMQIGKLAYLQILDLSYNNLSGVLPNFLGTSLLHLQLLNVSFNNFTGPIPTDEGVFKHLNASCFQGNPGLCGPVLKKECIALVQGKLHHHLQLIRNWKGALLIASVLLLGTVLLALAAKRYCMSKPADMADHMNVLTGSLAEARRYSAQVLMEATQGYSELNILGQGGLGVVYKGVLPDGKIVAVKKLKDIYNGSHKELLREMRILSKLRHRNLVRILGCVLSLEMKAVVLEYMARGSLEQYLDMHQLKGNNGCNIDQNELNIGSARYWEMVMRVAMGVAQALAYLHYEYGASIIHGDVKPGNILLDSNLEPHLADFGLAKLIDTEAVSLTSEYFKGSIGYMAPEYAYAARLTTKVDVYSYGVVLLRMLTGRSPMQVLPAAGPSLHEWVTLKLASLEERELAANWEELLDPALVQIKGQPLHNNADTGRSGASAHNRQQDLAVQLLRMSLACTAYQPDDRPTIQEVVRFLTHLATHSHSQ